MGEEDSERVEKQRGGGLEGRSGDNRGGGIIYERGVGVGRGRVCRGVEWEEGAVGVSKFMKVCPPLLIPEKSFYLVQDGIKSLRWDESQGARECFPGRRKWRETKWKQHQQG